LSEGGTARRIETSVSMEDLLADLGRYRQTAISLGAADARVIPANLVSVDERVRLKCAFPRCHLYG